MCLDPFSSVPLDGHPSKKGENEHDEMNKTPWAAPVQGDKWDERRDEWEKGGEKASRTSVLAPPVPGTGMLVAIRGSE
jgi:hypothetical protein